MGLVFEEAPKLKTGKEKPYYLETNCKSCGANEYKRGKCCYCGNTSNEINVYKNLIDLGTTVISF